MKDSSAKQPTVESSLCSPVAAPKKRKRQSGNAEIENFAMDFPFYCIFFSSLHIAVTRLFVSAERLALYLLDILHTQL